MFPVTLENTTALKLVCGELRFDPVAPDCIIQAALKEAKVEPPPGAGRPCRCPRCEP